MKIEQSHLITAITILKLVNEIIATIFIIIYNHNYDYAFCMAIKQDVIICTRRVEKCTNSLSLDNSCGSKLKVNFFYNIHFVIIIWSLL